MCGICNKLAGETVPVTPGALPHTLNQGVTGVLGRDGRMYPIGESLITVPHHPRRGWGVRFEVNTHMMEFTGVNPSFVFSAVKSAFILNNIVVSDLNLWYNLNLQWLERANDRYQAVTVKDLLPLSEHV